MTSTKLSNYLTLDRCPHCSIHNPHLEKVGDRVETTGQGEVNKRVWQIYKCGRCGGITLAWASGPDQNVQEFYPSRRQVSDCIPSPAKDYLQQAIESIHAPAGAVMLAASAVDAMLKVKGYSKGSLNDRINQARENHLITKEMAEWAHEVRLDANEPRHADKEAPLPSEDGTKKAVEFALSLAEFLFVLPARVEKGLAQARKSLVDG